MEFTALHPATAQLAIELQLADINAVIPGLREGDEYAAFHAMQTDLQNALLLFQDQTYAMDLLRVDHSTRVVFETLVQEERQAERDHGLACELSAINPDQTQLSTVTPSNHLGDRELGLSHEFQNFYSEFASATAEDHVILALSGSDPALSTCYTEQICGTSGGATTNHAESSTKHLSKGKRKATGTSHEEEHVTHILCSACMEQCARFDALELSCKRPGDITCHAYCRSCLIDLFQTSLTDTTLFPPRCCGIRIPVSDCLEFCPPALVKQYREKEDELAAPNPVYCSNRYCAGFIKPEYITADVAVCQNCEEETCAVCKNPRHKGLCPEDPTVQTLMDMAGKKRWQRCPKCRTMVELLVGCYHMR
jgi:E3 ubiquitin-protein ligase RNF144